MKIINNAVIDDNEAVLIAYGSNMSSGHKTASQAFEQVVKDLQAAGLFINKISCLWRSEAWPDPSQSPYVNAVISVITNLNAYETISVLHELEKASGRIRQGQRNAPRVLDLDLIAYGRQIIDEKDGLIVPHPRAHERGFVMGPLAEILPDWVHPGLGRTASALYESVTVAKDAHPLDLER